MVRPILSVLNLFQAESKTVIVQTTGYGDSCSGNNSSLVYIQVKPFFLRGGEVRMVPGKSASSSCVCVECVQGRIAAGNS